VGKDEQYAANIHNSADIFRKNFPLRARNALRTIRYKKKAAVGAMFG
jgi:hypothetical protein